MRQSIEILTRLFEDISTPRGVKKAAKESISVLQKGNISMGVRAAMVISMLDDASQDPNTPSHVRVAIYNVISLLEVIRD